MKPSWCGVGLVQGQVGVGPSWCGAELLSELQLLFHDIDVHLAELLRGEPQKLRVLTNIANNACVDQAKQLFANFLNVNITVRVPHTRRTKLALGTE